jgi:DNA relaxase NicK
MPVDKSLSPVFVDHLRFAVRGPVAEVEAMLAEWFAAFFAEDAEPLDLDEVELEVGGPAGNFSDSRTWVWRGLPMFRVLVAGQSTRGVSHVIIDGQSCAMVRPEAWPDLAAVAERRAWIIKRLDLTVDDDSGAWQTADDVEGAYDLGQFSPACGGGTRSLQVIDARRGGSPLGWTVYVGERRGRFFLRVYQKHCEVLAKHGEGAAVAIPRQRVRVELECKPGKGPDLPWDMLREPASYYAAHSPALEARSGGVHPRRALRVARDLAEAELWALVGHCRNSYGGTITQAYWALGGSTEAAVELVRMLMRDDARQPVPGVCEVAGGARPDVPYRDGLT